MGLSFHWIPAWNGCPAEEELNQALRTRMGAAREMGEDRDALARLPGWVFEALRILTLESSCLWRSEESLWDSLGNRNRITGLSLAAARLSLAVMANPILEAPGLHPGQDVPRLVLVGARMRIRTLLPGFLLRISAGFILP